MKVLMKGIHIHLIIIRVAKYIQILMDKEIINTGIEKASSMDLLVNVQK